MKYESANTVFKKKMETKLKELRDAIKTVNYKHLFLSVSYF